MTTQQRNLEDATWGVGVVDAEVKLYLLALVRTDDPDEAQAMSGLDDAGVASARAWLAQVGVLQADGSLNQGLLTSAAAERRPLVAG